MGLDRLSKSSFLLAPWLGAALLPGSASPGPTFHDVAGPVLGVTSNSFGVAWGDYDGDGDPDLFVSNTDAPGRLFRNEGGGVFADATPAVLAATGFGAAWGDADNDGDLDLYLARSGANRFFRNDGAGFVDATSGPLADPGLGSSVSWVDADNDGDLDLYLVNFNSSNRFFRNDGTGFVDTTPAALALNQDGAGAAWADYDGDGDADVYLTAGSGGRLIRNDGGGIFVDVTDSSLDLVGSSGVDWGDYDNDGDLDLYVGRTVSVNRLMVYDTVNGFTSSHNGTIEDASDAASVAWADYDIDGDLDLFVGNISEPNRLYRNEGFGVFNAVNESGIREAGSIRGAAWADYDADGDPDLYLAVFDGPNRLMRNDLNTSRHWLSVRLEGVASNRSAVGARAHLVAGGTTQIREVIAGSAIYSMNSLPLEFGLGLETVVDSLWIRWPSGLIQAVDVPGVDRVLHVVEDVTGLGVGDPVWSIPGVRLLPPVPNPFRTDTRIRYELDRPGPVRIAVFDARGRRRRTEEGVAHGPGPRAWTWSGGDDTGRPLPAGVYLVRLETGAGAVVRRVVRLP